MSVAERELVRTDVEAYLARYQDKELLRFVCVGSVDDGKSTLIGRLLHDTGMVYQDQLDAVKRATAIEGEEIDFSLFTDGLRAEREQGITIDVAYRYFATEKRKFIIADTPGHVQYTRNMATGASTADVAIILIDARLGVLEQSRRHAYIASLLGIPHLVVCVNKMDLVGWDREVYERIRAAFGEVIAGFGFRGVAFFPISALKGTNIVRKDERTTPWHEGGSVLEHLESVPVGSDRDLDDFRFPVQLVLRPHLDYRGFAGQIAAGVVRKGDDVIVLPSGKRSRVRAIDTFEGEVEAAFTPRSVTLRLEDEIDVSRGDMLVRPHDLPTVSRTFDAHLVWMSERPLDTQKTYLLKHTTQVVRAQVESVTWKKDMSTLEEVRASGMELNDIARVRMSCHRALCYDDYRKNRATGAFVLIDSLGNNTVAAGMIVGGERPSSLDAALKELRAGSALEPKTQVSPRERRERMGQKGATLWLTGLPGSGKWTLAYALERRLFDEGRTATVVVPVGEDLRSMISAAKAATDAGLITICAFASYKRADRVEARNRIGKDRFVHIYVNTDPELSLERRPEAKSKVKDFEPPPHPDITVALDRSSLDDAIDLILAELTRRGQFE